ncbi:MAG: thioredoxin-disulfide reductase [Elusimicrobia bacterium]|jgi:thioredoxin reductase (NADPH)|nr:thioredoxin-disulfide reductase [Elusimicrobiota bacterium]MBK7206877.1 thioredoxin-disulfide reductase [Elusimicrobiota bacterium]MBK7545697.1 thioredoxin-disulfide reductase [Elusimicrobiota bacterium]MBK7574960.1 thioredoxin-disulfide reductase [Elusimicrobiota bacterium]MBK7687773.1 thioredoxin-disulfide reductase [Elusimicrobiota bacterium]
METRHVVIIGSGPAGYTAALYTSRAGLKPLVLGGFMKGGQSGGQLMTTTDVENFPGFPDGIAGPELMVNMRKQAQRFGAEVLDKDVESVDFSTRPFKVVTDEAEYSAKAVIIATGATAKRLHNDAEAKFWNRGISACATCDGALPIFRNKPIAVIGGGDTAMEEALFLTRFGSQVILLHRRDEFRASKVMIERVRKNPKILLKTPYVLEDTHGEKTLEQIRIKNVATGAVETLAANGLFMAIGHEPNTGVFRGQIDLHDTGYVKTDGHTRTNVTGVFAAGDCVDHVYRQAVTAAGQGCMAAIAVERWLAEHPQ